MDKKKDNIDLFIELFENMHLNFESFIVDGSLWVPEYRKNDLMMLKKEKLINLEHEFKYVMSYSYSSDELITEKFFATTLTEKGEEFLKFYKEYKQL